MDSSRQRDRFRQATLLAVCNVVVLILAELLTNGKWSGIDFRQYYIVSDRLHRGAPVYDLIDTRADIPGAAPVETDRTNDDTEGAQVLRTANPPPFIVALWPLALASYPVAWWTALLGSLVLIAGIAFQVARRLFSSSIERYTWLAVSLGSFPTLVNGLLNHIEPFVWVFMAWGWARLRRGDERTAGVFWGLAGALKLFPLAFIPMLLVAGYRRACVWAAGAAMTAIAGSMAILGPESFVVYAREVLPQASQFRFSFSNVSAASLFSLFVSDKVALALCGSFFVWSLLECRRHSSPDQVYVLGVCCSLLCSPLCWTYYLVAALPCVMIAMTWARALTHRYKRTLVVFLFATLVYWPFMLGGLLIGLPLPRPLMIALNFIPTLGLMVMLTLVRVAPNRDAILR